MGLCVVRLERWPRPWKKKNSTKTRHAHSCCSAMKGEPGGASCLAGSDRQTRASRAEAGARPAALLARLVKIEFLFFPR